jgi:hypothetical protein
MYDVTAWSLPMQYGIPAIATAEVSSGSFEPVKAGELPPGKIVGPKPDVAYLVPWGLSSAARFLASALQEDIKIDTTDKEFKLAGREFPRGTLIVKVKENAADLPDKMDRLAKTSGAEIVATNTGWVDEGANFGSNRVFSVPKPTIALAWDRPTSSAAAGATRFVLEREYGYPVTVVRTDQLARGDLHQFDVIILPDTGGPEGYNEVLGANGARRLTDWVQSGGTLIGLGGGAVSWLADSRTGLLAITQEDVARPPDKDAKPPTSVPAQPPSQPSAAAAPAAPQAPQRVPGKLIATPEEFEKAIEAPTELPDSLHGVLIRAKVDPEQWVSAGVPDTVYVLASGRAIFTPIKLDRGFNAAYFVGPDQLLASGYIWDQNRKQLAYKPFVVVQKNGRGSVVGFTEDPNFRGYMDGLNLLFLNAVFRGPAHSR